MESQSRQVTGQILTQIFNLHQTRTDHQPGDAKQITGYCEPLSLRAGEQIQWFGSSHVPTSGRLDLVRLECGDPTRSGPGFSEHPLDSVSSLDIELVEQPLIPGSFAEAVLWTTWIHCGDMRSQTDAVLVALDAEKFVNTISQFPTNHPRDYAQAFVDILNDREKDSLSDLYPDPSEYNEICRESF